MNYLNVKLEDAWEMARRHGNDLIKPFHFEDDTVPIWASNNYNRDFGIDIRPLEISELCAHACFSVGAYKNSVISQEVYLRAMKNIDQMLQRYYGTSLEKELHN